MKLNNRALCICGCGDYANPGKNYIRGHNPSWNKGLTKEIDNRITRTKILLESQPCECKCGGYAKPGKRFIHGHFNRGKRRSLESIAKQVAKRKEDGSYQWTEAAKEKAKITRSTPEARLINSNAQKLYCAKPGVREQRSAIQKEVQNRPEVKAKKSKSQSKALSDPDVRKRMSRKQTEAMNREGMHEQTSRKAKECQNRPEVKLKNSLSQKAKWKDPCYVSKQMKSRNVKQNKLEKRGENLFCNLFPNEYKFTGHGEVIIDGKCPDFTNINGQKKIIEIYGDYWHKGDNPQDRIDIFAKFGYDTLIVWEREFKDIVSLTKKLIEFHHRENPYSKIHNGKD